MAYENLKTAIKQAIKQNGNQEITGNLLQSTLLNMVNTLGADYKFLGFATPSTVPPTSEEGRLFYFASEAGEYLNFPTSGENTHITIGEGLYVFTKEANSDYWEEEALIDIVQTTGEAEDKVMSQKAVSDKLSDLSSDIKDIKYLQYTEARYINYENGVTVSTVGSTTYWQTSDKFRVAVGTKIVYRFEGLATNVAFIAAYDKQGNYLKNKSVQGSTTFVEGTYIVEEGVYYIAICHYEQYSGTIQPYIQSQIDNLSESVDNLSESVDNLSESVGNLSSDIIYNSCVKKPIIFEGKKALFAGDSITYGFTSGLTNVHGTGDYPKIVSEKLGMNYKNAGVAGATITRFDDYGFIKDQIMTAERNDYDILFIAGGINDWQAGAELADFRKAIEDYCAYINNNYPNTTKVIWITPINQAGYRSSIAGGQKYAVQQYRNALTEVVLSNDDFDRFSIIQGSDLNFPTSNADESYITKMFGDKLHPTEYAYKNIYAAGLINLLI